MNKTALAICSTSLLAAAIFLSKIGSFQVFAADGAPSGQNVLCLYNASTNLSKAVCDYYVSKRPGARSFGVEIPPEAFSGTYEIIDGRHIYEKMSVENFNRYVAQPLMKKFGDDMSVRYLAVAKDVPITLSTGGNGYMDFISAANFLSFATNARTNGDQIRQSLSSEKNDSCLDFEEHFDPSECTSSDSSLKYRFAVSYLSGYTLDDIKMMIDKAAMPAPDLKSSKWVFDAPMPEGAADDYSFKNSGKTAEKWLEAQGIASSNILNNSSNTYPLKINGSVVAYGGTGRWHDKYGLRWIVEKPAIDMSVANRAVISAYESFFGVTSNTAMIPYLENSTIADALSQGAFGGKNYSRSFSGGIGTVAEPLARGVVSWAAFYADYASGKNFGDSIIRAARARPMVMAIGDPLMRLDVSGAIKPENVAPVLVMGTKQVVKLPDSAIITAKSTDDGLPWYKVVYSWQKIQGPGDVTIDTPSGTTLWTGDAFPIQTIVRARQPGSYRFRLTVSDGIYSRSGEVDVVFGEPNNPPVVSAGPDMNVDADNFPVRIPLSATAADPDSGTSLKLDWRQGGPAVVRLSCTNRNDLSCSNPVAEFSTPGKYGFLFSADDGYRKVLDSVVVNVTRRSSAAVQNPRPATDPIGVVPRPAQAPAASDVPVVPVSNPTVQQPSTSATGVIAAISPANPSSSKISAGSSMQTLGGFEVNVKNEGVRVSNLVFILNLNPMSRDPVKEIVLSDLNGNVLAGPTEATALSSNNTWYSSSQRFVLAGPVTFPMGVSQYLVKASIPSSFANNMTVTVRSNPSLGWTEAVGASTGKKVDVSSLPPLTLSTMTVSNSVSSLLDTSDIGATVIRVINNILDR